MEEPIVSDLARDCFEQCPIWDWADDNEHYCPAPYMEPFPSEYASFISANMVTASGQKLEGYISYLSANVIGIFVDNDQVIFNRALAALSGEYVEESLVRLFELLECDPFQVFPIKYDTGLHDLEGNRICGVYTDPRKTDERPGGEDLVPTECGEICSAWEFADDGVLRPAFPDFVPAEKYVEFVPVRFKTSSGREISGRISRPENNFATINSGQGVIHFNANAPKEIEKKLKHLFELLGEAPFELFPLSYTSELSDNDTPSLEGIYPDPQSPKP